MKVEKQTNILLGKKQLGLWRGCDCMGTGANSAAAVLGLQFNAPFVTTATQAAMYNVETLFQHIFGLIEQA